MGQEETNKRKKDDFPGSHLYRTVDRVFVFENGEDLDGRGRLVLVPRTFELLLVACGKTVESLSFAPRRLFNEKGRELKSLKGVKDGMKVVVTDGEGFARRSREIRTLKGSSASRYSERVREDIIRGNTKEMQQSKVSTAQFKLGHEHLLFKSFHTNRLGNDYLRTASEQERVRRGDSLYYQKVSEYERAQTARVNVQEETRRLKEERREMDDEREREIRKRISALGTPRRASSGSALLLGMSRTATLRTAPAALESAGSPRSPRSPAQNHSRMTSPKQGMGRWVEPRNKPYVEKLLPVSYR